MLTMLMETVYLHFYAKGRIFVSDAYPTSMKTRLATLLILVPFLFACGKPNGVGKPDPPQKFAVDETVEEQPGNQEEENNQNPGEQEPEIPADAILVTNPYMDKYLEEVHYPEGDFTYSLILSYPGGGPGEADIPPTVTLSWPAGTPGKLALHLVEEDLVKGDDEWTRDYSLAEGTTSQDVSNLVPNKRYVYTVSTSEGKEVYRDTFYTKGHLHQIFFTKKVRNGRDLGGWKTYDGRTVKYRKLFRSGKPSDSYIDAKGRTEALAQGIKAELILRSDTSSEDKNPPLGASVDRYGPGFENGYSKMMKETEKVKGCFDFVLKCLREDKPVLFHCSIGSDRTGTMSILLLGLLGVPEPDVCKDFELSYFAPEDWSMTNGVCNRVRTYKSRYLDAINYILTFGKGNFRDHVEAYFLSIGVTSQEITEFRNLMLK